MARDHDKPGFSRLSDVVLRRIGPLKREPVEVIRPEWAEQVAEPVPAQTVIHNPPSTLPQWQKPFKPLPNVRYTRTPDPLPAPRDEAAPAPGLDSFEAMAALIDNGYSFADAAAQPEPAPAEPLDAVIARANVRYTRSPDLLTLKKSRVGQAAAPHSHPPQVLDDPEEAHEASGRVSFDPHEAHLSDTVFWESLELMGEPLPEAPAETVATNALDESEDAEAAATTGPLNDNAPKAVAPPAAAPPAKALPPSGDFGLHAPTMAMLAAQLARRTPVAAAPVARAPVIEDDLDEPEDIADEEIEAPAFTAPVYVTRRTPVAPPPAPAVKAVEAPRPAVAAPAVAAPIQEIATLRPSHNPQIMRPIAGYELPPIELLAEPLLPAGPTFSPEVLEQNARLLEGILEDFGIRGEIIDVRPGPVVTLYELEPAAGIKSSRVIGLADDIARSMSALSARVAVIPGRNVIGIELPNAKREMVYFRELIGSEDFEKSKFKLALSLGKTIGGEPVIAQLEKMPHLLVAGTTGSGKSVAINTMILSLLYRLKPEECRLIMVDPKMLELSIYDGIPHLLCPVVTDPKKAVLALKWAVREMEERYKKMSKLGVRNIDGYNTRASAAREAGEVVTMQVQTGFEKATGKPTYDMQEMDLSPMPYIVVIVDEMADLMMVAGKDIEGAIQRLAQMARAAGIHLIMATQRPSVDVITGTIKANFPTRISFQVTSKIDSRTILGEQGAEQLLGQGDMLHMIGGGRISRVHGPFVSDEEVEKVVRHLKAQGQPAYLDAITADDEGLSEETEGEADDGAVFDRSAMAGEDVVDKDLYDQALKVVLRDKKCSTSYIQRRLQIGYNKAASLVERMEKEGLVGAANHAGKREILVYSRDFAKGYQGGRDGEDEEE